MLASITPLGERGRGGHWGITVTAFALGAAGAGGLAGALAGTLGAAGVGMLGARERFALLAVAVLVAIALDARAHDISGPRRRVDRPRPRALGRTVPGPRRQVDERWLDEYRGWVYGLGYGAQLGLGVTTVITSAATYVALGAAVLTADPPRGALVVGLYGAIRGLTPLVAAGVRAPDQLLSLHLRLAWCQTAIARAGLLVLAAIFVVAVAGSIG